jgi:hypothetical protein
MFIGYLTPYNVMGVQVWSLEPASCLPVRYRLATVWETKQEALHTECML